MLFLCFDYKREFLLGKYKQTLKDDILSYGNNKFKLFVKSKEAIVQLQNVIADNYGVNLYSETWTSGTGGKIKNSKKVTKLKKLKSPKIEYKSNKDHSKFVFQKKPEKSEQGGEKTITQYLVCIGDLNRMVSPFHSLL